MRKTEAMRSERRYSVAPSRSSRRFGRATVTVSQKNLSWRRMALRSNRRMLPENESEERREVNLDSDAQSESDVRLV